jgi:hypothetical protein
MTQLCAIVRLLMLAACLMPFTSVRQAGVALAPMLPLLPVAPAGQAPAPVNEEDERETADGKERLNASQAHRRAPHTARSSPRFRPPRPRRSICSVTASALPIAVSPFHTPIP